MGVQTAHLVLDVRASEDLTTADPRHSDSTARTTVLPTTVLPTCSRLVDAVAAEVLYVSETEAGSDMDPRLQ